MNMLSLFIYFADVAPTFANGASFFFIVSALISAVGAAIFLISYFMAITDKSPHVDLLKSWFSTLLKFMFTFIILNGFTALIPSRQTFYLIAGSEISGKVLTSDRVDGIVDPTLKLINQKIQLELEKINSELAKLPTKNIPNDKGK